MARPGNIGDDFVWSPAEGCRPAGQPLQLHSASCVSGRCLRCRRVQTQCRFSCRFQRSSVQFDALDWQHLVLHTRAIRTWDARGGWDSSIPRRFLVGAGRRRPLDAQAASDLAPATARRWPTASPPASHWCRSCSVGGMQRTGSSLHVVVIAAKIP